MEKPKSENISFEQGFWLTFVVLAIFIGFVVCAPWLESRWHEVVRGMNPDDNRDIQGTWVVVMAELEGKSKPVGRGMWNMVFKGDTFHSNYPGASPNHALSFVLDPVRKAIDLTGETEGSQEGEKPDVGLYQLSANRLVLCIARRGQARPKDLESATGNALVILERK
jgi:uncharacterized protein (TIGR03067 family)